MSGAGKTIGGTGDFSTVALMFYTSGSSTTLTSNVSLSKMYLGNPGTDPILNLSSYILAVSTTFNQYGVINLNTGTLEYSGTASQSASTWVSTNSTFGEGTGTVYFNNSGSWSSYYPTLDYYNLKFKTNSGQEHDGPGSETIANNLELVAGTSGGKLHHHSTTLAVGGNVTIGAGSELNLNCSTCKSITVTGNIDVSGTITCYSTSAITTSGNLTINSGGTITSSTSSIVSVGGNWVNNGTFTKSTGTVKFTGAANKTISGSTTTSFYNLTVDKGTDTTYCIEATGAMGMTGNLTLTNGVLKLTHASSSAQFATTTTIPSTAGLWVNGGSFTVGNYTTTNNGLIRLSSGSITHGTTSGNNLGNSGASAVLNITGGTFNLAGRLISSTSALVNISGGTATFVTVGTNHSTLAGFECDGSSYVTMTGGTVIIQIPNTSTGGELRITSGAGTKSITGGTFQIGNASTAAGKVFLIDCSVPIYNLTVYSTNEPTARLKTSALTVSNTVTISGGILDANTNALNMTVGGNWINNSSTTSNSKIGFDSGSKKVTFNGGAAQTISGSAVTTFYDFDLANTSGDVTLAVNSTINNALTLTSGKFIVQAYTLTVGTTSSNGSISGGSSSCYIVAYDNSGTIGYLKRFINSNATYTFQIGDATNYTPLTFVLSAGTLSSAYLTLYTKAVKVTGLNSAITNYINRYWNLSQSGITSPTYDISYTYVDGDIVGTETGMLPIKKSGTTWYKPTGSSFTTGTAQGTGSLTAGSNLLSWTGLSTFSLYGGAVDGGVALPITLVSFTGEKDAKNNVLIWETASELNNDFFTIERTYDGETYEIVGTEDGAGYSTGYLEYTLVDHDVREVINYYRLKQTDFDGKYTFSNLIAIDNRTKVSNKEVVLRVNILGQEVNEFFSGVVIVLYSDGTSAKVIQ